MMRGKDMVERPLSTPANLERYLRLGQGLQHCTDAAKHRLHIGRTASFIHPSASVIATLDHPHWNAHRFYPGAPRVSTTSLREKIKKRFVKVFSSCSCCLQRMMLGGAQK
jgi:hypothetical protein